VSDSGQLCLIDGCSHVCSWGGDQNCGRPSPLCSGHELRLAEIAGEEFVQRLRLVWCSARSSLLRRHELLVEARQLLRGVPAHDVAATQTSLLPENEDLPGGYP